LTDLLKCVGEVYIILDGLDEVSKNEHMVDILNELLKILNDCTEVKLFVSSRAQDEIGSMLNKASAKEIRVDEKNSGCIHAYVIVTTDEWLSKAGFDQQDCDEIKDLLKPLSTKAKGIPEHQQQPYLRLPAKAFRHVSLRESRHGQCC
jgi:hypothetical protein